MNQIEYVRPWMYPKQEAAIFNPSRYSLIEASTKSGKTTASMFWQFEKSLLSPEYSNHWWVAPVFGQAQIAYDRMRRGVPASLINASNMTIEILPLKSKIWFKSADNADSLYGDDVYTCVMDEASRTKEDAFFAVRSTLTATNGMIRMIGNIKGRKNWFYRMCRKAEAGAPDMEYHKITAADAVAAGVIAQEEIDDAQRNLPENVFRELYLAEPSDDGGNPFGLKSIEQCIKPLSRKEPRVWGWDLAKSVDWTVGIGLDEDGNTCRVVRFQKPWRDTKEEIKRETGMCPALVDSTGVGDPVLEDLQAGGGSYEGFKFSQHSKQQLMEGLAVAIQQQKIGFPDGVIVNELESFEYEYTRTGVRYSAPQGFHDDCVVALALANSAYASGYGFRFDLSLTAVGGRLGQVA